MYKKNHTAQIRAKREIKFFFTLFLRQDTVPGFRSAMITKYFAYFLTITFKVLRK